MRTLEPSSSIVSDVMSEGLLGTAYICDGPWGNPPGWFGMKGRRLFVLSLNVM